MTRLFIVKILFEFNTSIFFDNQLLRNIWEGVNMTNEFIVEPKSLTEPLPLSSM